MQFKNLEPEDIMKIMPFVGRRPNKTCDSGAVDSLLWRE